MSQVLPYGVSACGMLTGYGGHDGRRLPSDPLARGRRYGAVYEALNDALERRVAIKILHPDFARQPDVVNRFFNEARAVNRIAHPSLVQVHEFGYLPDGTAFIVMEFLGGETVAARLAQTGSKLAQKTALQIAWQVAAALTAAHEKDIIHRDLPANLMLVPDPLGPGASG